MMVSTLKRTRLPRAPKTPLGLIAQPVPLDPKAQAPNPDTFGQGPRTFYFRKPGTTAADRLKAWREYPYKSTCHPAGKVPDYVGCVSIQHAYRPLPSPEDRNPSPLFQYEQKRRPFRFIGFCDDVCKGIRHTGWYASEHGDSEDTYRGVVFQIPARGGAERFLAGWEYKGGDFGSIEIDCVYNDKEEAARAADSIAQTWAERNKEYLFKEDTENRAAELKEEAKTARAELREAYARRRELKAAGVSLVDVNATIGKLKRDLEKTAETLEKLEKDPWSVLYGRG